MSDTKRGSRTRRRGGRRRRNGGGNGDGGGGGGGGGGDKPRGAQGSSGGPASPASGEGEPGEGFRQFGLGDDIMRGVINAGWVHPTEIQERLIPEAMKGGDVVGQARTGTGKTGAFLLPILNTIEPGGGLQALVVAPVRELALQVRDEAETLARGLDIRTVTVYGGASIKGQADVLREGAELVVGTPGRLIDMTKRGHLELDKVRFLVLDECDRMFDLGFRDDIDWIMRRTRKDRQTLLLSATIPPPILRLAKKYMTDHTEIHSAQENPTVESAYQAWVPTHPKRKVDTLETLIKKEEPGLAIIFTRTRRGAARLAANLKKRGWDAREIHGDLPQSKRERIMRDFRDGDIHLLVATDVAGRGIDVAGITHVINYDIPENPEDYVHRIGRTARMGADGRAITFVTPEQGPFLDEIEKNVNLMLDRLEIDGAPPPPKATQKPREESPLMTDEQREAKKRDEGRPDFGAGLLDEDKPAKAAKPAEPEPKKAPEPEPAEEQQQAEPEPAEAGFGAGLLDDDA